MIEAEEDAMARLTSGLAEDERIAQAALERWQDDFVDNPDAYGHLGGYVHDHAERFDPARELRQAATTRKLVELALWLPADGEPFPSHMRDDLLRALFAVYSDSDETEKP